MNKMNLLFDLDGTLTDPHEGITKSIIHALTSLGRPSPHPDELFWCIGPPLKKSFSILLETEDETLVERAMTIYRERFGSIGLFENKVYAGIPGALKSLGEMGHTLHLATSKPRIFARRIVEHFDLDQYFNSIHGSELDGTRTDKASLIAYILQNESLDPLKAAMIGDRKHDMIGARANCLPGFGVLWGFGSESELTNSGAGVCIKTPSDLISSFA